MLAVKVMDAGVRLCYSAGSEGGGCCNEASSAGSKGGRCSRETIVLALRMRQTFGSEDEAELSAVRMRQRLSAVRMKQNFRQ